MVIPISRESTFDVPAGKYRATLKEVIHLENRPTKRGLENQVRLLFELQTPEFTGKQYLAGKNYETSLGVGSALRKDLASWRGCDLTDEELRNGTFDLDCLIGRPADVQIAHVTNAGFAKPFVHIKGIRPPGKWIKQPMT